MRVPINDTDEMVADIHPDGWPEGYIERWECGLSNAPKPGTFYRVTSDEWNEDYTVRTIKAWEVTQ